MEPGGALLSHGGPHYHRRWAVSLPRSGWDRVVPARPGRQAILSRPSLAAVPAPLLPACPGLVRAGIRPPSAFLFSAPRAFRRGGSGIRTFGHSLPGRVFPGQGAWALHGQASRAISTGQLSASPRLHTPPINLVVFQGPSGGSRPQGGLILGGASRLDAFSGYPVRTWLPGDASGETTGTPAVRPLRSSRTRSSFPQTSSAHGR